MSDLTNIASIAQGVGNATPWGAIASGISNTVNAGVQLGINELNYQRQLAQQQEVWNREDTYIERMIKQATENGVSPLAVLGIQPSTTSVVQPNAIAPQINGLAEATGSDLQLAEQRKKNQNDFELGIKGLNLKKEEIEEDERKYRAQVTAQLQSVRETNLNAKQIAEMQTASQEFIKKMDNAVALRIAGIQDSQARYKIKQEWEMQKKQLQHDFEILEKNQSWQERENAKNRVLSFVNNSVSTVGGIANTVIGNLTNPFAK